MNKIFKFATLLSVCLMAFAGCAPEELSTDQFSDDSVTLAGFAPNPVARGGVLRITGSNLQKVTEVIIPGIDPITNIEVVAEGRHSEIRVVVPVDGPEVGPIGIFAGEELYVSTADLTYSEPIIFNGFSPANAMPGDVVTIKGDYMNNIKAIQFEGGATVTEFVEQSRYEMKVVVPATAITGKIILCDVDENNNPDGLVANMFYSEEVLTIGDPTVESEDRKALKVGDKVTVIGKYLNMIESANFGGVDVEFIVNDAATAIELMLPATAVDGELVLVSYAGKEFKAGTYTTIVPTELKIAADTRYKAGLNATITGKDLDLVTGAALAGTALEYVLADGKLTFAIPAAAVDGAVTLTLANGKTVDTEAITLVKPVITEVAPLELYAEEKITIKGEDLDLVTGVTLGGKEETFELVDGTIEITTAVTSVSGKIVLTLANGVAVESTNEIKVNYHSLVIVTEMPTAEHIGMEVVLKGSNFDLVENIFIGDVKVTQYSLRTPEEVRFLMPWNKVGMYTMSFHLFNGDVENVATQIEVQLELNITTIWEGYEDLGSWSNQPYFGSETAFSDAGLKIGDYVRMYFTPLADFWQFQTIDGHWGNLVLDELGGTHTLTSEMVSPDATYFEFKVTPAVHAQLTAAPQGWGGGMVCQGEGVAMTRVEVIQEIAQEKTIWEGSFNNAGWAGNQDLAWGGFDWTTVSAGQTMTIYGAPNDPNSDWWCVSLRVGDGWANLNGVPGQYDNPTDIKVELTQEIIDHLIAGQGLVVTGDGYTMTKITIL